MRARTSFYCLALSCLLTATGCSCSSGGGAGEPASPSETAPDRPKPDGTETDGTKPDDPETGELPPVPGIEQCNEGRDRRCLHADADDDGVSVAQGDCDDKDPASETDCTEAVAPEPPSTCSGADCGGADQDGDGVTPAEGDCDDADERVFAGAPDPCGDGKDSDCDGFAAECRDADADGDGETLADGDCNDLDLQVSSRAFEVCGDGVDNDCDGGDRSCDATDADGDGVTLEDGDCDDADPSSAPVVQELCGDGVDNDCDGSADADCVLDIGIPLRVPLSTDQPLTLRVRVALPDARAGDIGADVMFLVDQSASFDDDISTFRSSASSILGRLSGSFGDLRLGLASFRDAPCASFGSVEALEWAYKLNLPLTSEHAAFEAVMDTLATAPGLTTPEAALEGIGQVLTGRGHRVDGFATCDIVADIAPSSPGWKQGRIPLLVVSTDAPFNRPGDPEFPYPTTVTEVIQLALDSGTRIFFMSSGDRDPEDQLIADATGGEVFELAGDSTGIVMALGAAIDGALGDVEVELVPQGPGAELIDEIEPARIAGVNLLVDDEVEFKVTLRRTITRKSMDQKFEFELVLVTEGIESTRIPVTVIIPGIDV